MSITIHTMLDVDLELKVVIKDTEEALVYEATDGGEGELIIEVEIPEIELADLLQVTDSFMEGIKVMNDLDLLLLSRALLDYLKDYKPLIHNAVA